MSYRGVDRTRFTYLLSLGTDEFELSKFFNDCRLLLIHHGAKVQNLPRSHRSRIRTIAAELPRATDDIVQSWFSKHVTMVDPEEAEAVVGVFKRYEEVSGTLPEEDARRYARSCLVHLFSKVSPHSILDFLRTPIDGRSKGDEQAKEIVEEPSEVGKTAGYPVNIPQIFIRLIDGKDADECLEGLPPELATFVIGLQSAARGETNEARGLLDVLPPDSLLRTHLEQFVSNREGSRPSRGLQIAIPEMFDGAFDYERDDVLGYCTKADPPGAVFVHPLGVMRGAEIQLLNDENRREFFPETGDLISFTGPRYPHQPRRGEIGVWKVAEHHTEKATRFHLASQKVPVYEVRPVPFASADYDAVREFLKEQAEPGRAGSLQPLLYQLSDGLIISSRTERPDLSKEESFDSGLVSWNSLSAFRLEGRLFVLGTLPKQQGIYECAALGSTMRKLFRSHVGAGKVPGGLTRVQITQLAKSLDDVESGLDSLRIQRVRAELERLGQQREAFETLVVELMKQPDVKQRIDRLIEDETARQLSQKTNFQAEIARLQKDHGEWKDRVRREQAQHKKLSDETSRVVKAAFEKARADGVLTLAKSAIFQALSLPANEARPAIEAFPRYSVLPAPMVTRDLASGDKDVISMFRSLGISGQCAAVFATIGEIAHKAGLIVCVTGVAARLAVEAWARAIANSGVLIETSVGLIDDSRLRDILGKVPRPDVLALLDANLSALDIYARPVSDLILGQLSMTGQRKPLAVFLALADGVGALPVPKTFDRVSVLIDLDRRYSFHDLADLDELMSTATNPEDGSLYTRLWRPAADRLRVVLDEIEPEKRVRVLSVLATK